MSEIIKTKTTNLLTEYLTFIKSLKNENNNDFDFNSIDSMTEKFETKISNKQMIALINENNLWTKYLQKTLKTSLNEETNERFGERLLQLVYKLIDKLSPNETPLETSLEIICGHSMFEDILIDEKFVNSELKHKLVSILCLIYEKDINLVKNMNNEMISIILSAYNLSMTKTDQKLLKLLSFLEKTGLNLYKYQPFLWGVNGALHYSVKNKQKETLLKEPKMEQILSSINENQLKYTLNNFPIHLPLNPIEVIDLKDGHELTDPRFLLPLLYQLLSNQSIVKCHKFVSYGCLSYTIASLSSLCEDMRRLGYCVLSRFYSHLEMATYPNDRFLWIAIIDYIRSGITEDNARVKSLISVLVIRIIDILLHPNDKLYQNVRKFLTNRPTIDSNVLPDFYTNLYSSDNETHKRLQRFIISWICDGLRTEDDVKLCLKRNVFSELMTLFDSGLSDDQNPGLILNSLQRICSQYIGAKVLCTENALFCWLKLTIFNSQNDSHFSSLIDEIFKIVETVSQTFKKSLKPIYPSFYEEVIHILELIIEMIPKSDRTVTYVQFYEEMKTSGKDCHPFHSNIFQILSTNDSIEIVL